MHDVTWRTGCTFTILVLLALLGSGRLIEAPSPTPTPLPTGEATRSASNGAGLSTPETGAVLPEERGGTLSPEALADGRRPATHVNQVPRQPGGQAEVWR